MAGTNEVRHCGQCNKNVYNLSAMTRRRAEAVLRETEGRLCARLYRRADGTILTENCPAGLRAIGRRISRVAGAAMSAVATFSSATAAQFPMLPIPAALREVTSTVSGVVMDESGAVIPGSLVELLNSSGKKLTSKTDGSGRFEIVSLLRGAYTVRIEANGFSPITKQITLVTPIKLTTTLKIGYSGMGGAIVAENAK